jgi:hypothetical protein
MEILFARLPPRLRVAAIRRVGAFLLENTLTSGESWDEPWHESWDESQSRVPS